MARKILYHGTSVKNLESILEKGIIQKYEGVYLTDSEESAARWCGFKLHTQGENQVAVIKVIVDEDKLEPGVDHSPMMHTLFGVGESLLHSGDIPNDMIMGYSTYQIGGKK
jgi:hypothetical protein